MKQRKKQEESVGIRKALRGPRGNSDLLPSRANPAELKPFQYNACSEFPAHISRGFHSKEPCATDRYNRTLKVGFTKRH
jgi:hypothetical protein